MYVQRCTGCGRLAVDAAKDLEEMVKTHPYGCCPERKLEYVEVHGAADVDSVADALLKGIVAYAEENGPLAISHDGGVSLQLSGFFSLRGMAEHLLQGVVNPIGDEKHWKRIAEERTFAANAYLERARKAEANSTDWQETAKIVLGESGLAICKAKAMLDLCVRTFQEYAQMHAAKGPGHEGKVERNRRMAQRCADVIEEL